MDQEELNIQMEKSIRASLQKEKELAEELNSPIQRMDNLYTQVLGEMVESTAQTV